MAASARPPHLKAIFPTLALFDIYGVAFHNGVFFDDLIRTWSDLTMELDKTPGAAPVDGENDEALLKAALEKHAHNRRLIDIVMPLRFRDGRYDSFTKDGILIFRNFAVPKRLVMGA